MIKLKNLWKVALATMAMTAMLVACDEGSSSKDDDKNSGAVPGIYVAGLVTTADANPDWASDTDANNAHLMTEGENEVYTFTFTAVQTNIFPFGFKFCTENGWMEQYQAYNEEKPSDDFTILDPDEESAVYYSTKTKLEASDSNGNKIKDEATKFRVVSTSVFQTGKKYTITFDKANMKVKISGDFKKVQVKKITVTIKINDEAKLILTDVPTYDVDDIATIDGSLFSWCKGLAESLKATNCEVSANWTGAEDNNWVAAQAPKTDGSKGEGSEGKPVISVDGADAWAKLVFSADGIEGWVPYSTTGTFTYSWNNRK